MKQFLTRINKYLPFIGLLIVAGAFLVFYFASQQKQDVRKKAAVVRGRAVLVVSPENETKFAKDSLVSVNVAISLQSIAVDGFQLVATLTGDTSGDLTFQPALPPEGMRAMVNQIIPATNNQPATLKVAYITQDPNVPYAKEGLVPLGTITMTAPGQGSLAISFDQTASKVTQHISTEDILEISGNPTYTFYTPDVIKTCNPEKLQAIFSVDKQSTEAGKPLTYLLSMSNNDSPECQKETITVSPVVPVGWDVKNPNEITIEPQKSTLTPFIFTAPLGTAIGDQQIKVRLRGESTSLHNADVIGTYTILSTKPVTLKMRVKFTGVTDAKANGAKVKIRFVKGDLDYLSDPVVFIHIGEGIYQATMTLNSILVPGPGYQLIVKGEKHVARKFCKPTGQTSPCRSFDTLAIPEGSDTPAIFDFTGISLDPGDLPDRDGFQDGKVDRGDIQKLRDLMKKSCGELSEIDKLVGDLNYDGCIDTSDAILLRRTLETRYDEN